MSARATATSFRSVAELLAAGGSRDDLGAAMSLLRSITAFLDRARMVSPAIDRTCLMLVIAKLEEAELWAWESLQLAVDERDGRPPHAVESDSDD